MNYHKQIEKISLKRTIAIENKKQIMEKIDKTKRVYEATAIVQDIIQSLSMSIQQEMHTRIAKIVTKCLETVFDDPYEFIIQFEKKRGKTEAELLFKRNGELYDPLTESGGGVIEVAIIGLNLARLLLENPAPKRIFFADEPFKHLGTNNPERVKSLLMELSKEFKIQIVQITHNPKLVVGKEVRL